MNVYQSKKGDHVQILTLKILRSAVCIFLCILSILPFWIMLVNSTRNTVQIQSGVSLLPSIHLVDNLKALFSKTDGNITPFTYLKNSCIVSFSSVLVCVYFSSLTAYGIFTYRFRGRKFLWTLIIAVMLVPTQVSSIGYFRQMYDWGLVNSYWSLILPSIAAPSTVFFVRQYMTASLPMEIVDAARIDGCGEWKIFNRIIIPIIKPAIATQMIFCFIASWNSYYMPSMLISRQKLYTLPMFIEILKSDIYRTDYGIVYAGLMLTILPMLIIYILLSKNIVAGVALGGVKE